MKNDFGINDKDLIFEGKLMDVTIVPHCHWIQVVARGRYVTHYSYNWFRSAKRAKELAIKYVKDIERDVFEERDLK